MKGSAIAASPFKLKYGNFIGGEFVAPVKGEYFDNISPIDGKVFTKAARSTKEDIELALDAAHKAFETWGKSSVAERSRVLNKIADIMEENLEYLAAVETIDNGKALSKGIQMVCVNGQLVYHQQAATGQLSFKLIKRH